MSDGWPTPPGAPPGMPPGWYPDPWYPACMRYWDGAQWTLHAQSVNASATDPLDLAGSRKAAGRAAVAFIVQAACSSLAALFGPVLVGGFVVIFRDAGRTSDSGTALPGGPAFALGNVVLQVAGLANVVCLVLIVVWAGKATTTTRALGRATTHTPGWAIAGWIVPIINYWYPYQVVRDLLPPDHRLRGAVTRWWACYLAGSFGIFVPMVLAALVGVGVGVLAAVVPVALLWTAALTARQLAEAIPDVHEAEAAAARAAYEASAARVAAG